MKNTIMLLIFSLFFTVSFSQTPSFTVYYFNAERSNEGEIAAAYDDFLKELSLNQEVRTWKEWIGEMLMVHTD